ncbi:MAG: ATP-dependent metallopeptidase FtsH/Yme1/Tma family protein [Anaerolineales bacterium]
MDNNEQPPQKTGLSWIWWVILVALILWNVYMFLPKSQPEVSLPYSTFLNQVKAGNVSEVHISGIDITGTLV